MEYRGKVEYAQERKLRTRNTRLYRLAHWPIWIFVFFLAPGPLTFKLFAHESNWWNWAWLGLVLAGTGVAALRGRLPGTEPGPYILRFDEDKPNPLYRKVCYTFAWNAGINPTNTTVASERTNANATIRQSAWTSPSRGTSAGIRARSDFCATRSTARAAAPPASDMRTLSVSTCRTSWPRDAPSA